MTKRKRVLTWLGSSAILVALYAWFFGVATMLSVEARYVGWKAPIVKRRPISLSDLSISADFKQKLAYAGYEFEVPWAVDDKKTKQISPTSEVIVFDSGNALWFSRVPPKEFVNGLRTSWNLDAGSIKKLYGGGAGESDYSLVELILEATPQEVGLLSDRRQAAGTMMLLVLKGIMISRGGETGIFKVQTHDFRGFQYGDPQRRPKSIDVEIFADDGGLAFLFAQRETGPVPAITQAEINRVIQSARKVPEGDLSTSR